MGSRELSIAVHSMLRPVAPRPPLLVLALCVLVGCGDSGPSDEEQIRSTLAQFGTATGKRDYGAVCERVLAPKLVQSLERDGDGEGRPRHRAGALQRRGPGPQRGHGRARQGGRRVADRVARDTLGGPP